MVVGMSDKGSSDESGHEEVSENDHKNDGDELRNVHCRLREGRGEAVEAVREVSGGKFMKLAGCPLSTVQIPRPYLYWSGLIQSVHTG